MQTRTMRLAMAAVGLSGMAIYAGATPLPLPGKLISTKIQQNQLQQQKPTKQEVAAKLKEKLTEVNALKEKASETTKKIGDLAKEGSLPTSQEGIKVLQDLVEQLKQTNDALRKVQEDVEGILGWIEGQKTLTSALQKDNEAARKVVPSFFTNFQWQDTQTDPAQTSAPNDGFQLRNVRIGALYKPNPHLSAKASVEFATGGNRLAAELRDAFITFDMDKGRAGDKLLLLGQMPVPVGQENERSSADIEFPERVLYNRRLFAGERDRGVQFRKKIDQNLLAHFGIWNGLTIADPQQSSTFRDLDSSAAFHIGVRYSNKNASVGLSTFQGTRPGFVPNSGPPVLSANRALYYVDAVLSGFHNMPVTLRLEYMWGRDRDPIGGVGNPSFRQETSVEGFHGQLSYSLNKTNQLHVRLESYDPDVKDETGQNQRITTWGYAYSVWLDPNLRVTLSYETPSEQGTQVRNNVWTIRSTFKL